MRKAWLSKLMRRRAEVILLMLMQAALIIYLVASGSQASIAIDIVCRILSVVVALHIISQRKKGAYKLTWIFLILIFPLFGGLFYILFVYQNAVIRSRRKITQIEQESRTAFLKNQRTFLNEIPENYEYSTQMNYLTNYALFPAYDKTSAHFLSSGEKMFEALCSALKEAKHYIFLEYFIIEEGKMWNTVLNILKEKAAAGVEVRLMYDDMGCFLLLPHNYPKILKKYGIQCRVFNRFTPFLSITQNNRDHRKIAVIDGEVAITGGVNLADEYINEIEKYGHWKDSAVILKGDGAKSFALTFLQLWNLYSRKPEDPSCFFPEKSAYTEPDGYVIPYADSPTDNENVAEHIYLQTINSAKKYLYITTPYLIIDDSMVSALTLAAKSGIDVRIITPGKWDKRLVHFTTRSYYRELISAGVKIYEYKDGFIHSKTFVVDDKIGTVGTVNLDFRSLYLHFECGVWLQGSSAVLQIKDEFLLTLKQCRKITIEDCHKNAATRFIQDACRLFAPLM